MKTPKKIIVVILMTIFISSHAQTINWAALNDNTKHIISAQAGMEYGVVTGVGYSYRLSNKLFPAFLNVEFSKPSGKNFLDDFKTKIGGQVSWITYNNFQFSTRIQGVYRKYGNDFVNLQNFGSDLAAVVGYYRRNWFVATEFGFDKAVVTRFVHTDGYKSQFAQVVDGWYEPPSAGNYYYGIHAGVSFGKHDITLKAGKIIAEDFKSIPTIPFYGQLGYNFKF